MDHGLESVLKFFDEPVRLENIDDPDEDKDALPPVVPGRDPARRQLPRYVERVTGGLQAQPSKIRYKVTLNLPECSPLQWNAPPVCPF